VVHASDVTQFVGLSGTPFSPAQSVVRFPVDGAHVAHHDQFTGRCAFLRTPFTQNARSTRRERRDHHPLIPS
jgi:hypothetical protein